MFAPPAAIAEQFGVPEPEFAEPRYNISPTQPVAVIRWDPEQGSTLDMLRWGLIPHWAKDASIGNRMINARAETVTERPAFRVAFSRRRCLVLASGFYEWGQTPTGKWPFFIGPRDGQTMAFAGLWERWQPAADQVVESCVIITTAASPFLAKIHERMPVILPPDGQTLWLRSSAPREDCLDLLRSVGEERLKFRRVERTVNNPASQGAELLEPAAAE